MLTYAQARVRDITGTWNAQTNVVSDLPAGFNKLTDYYTPADTLYAVSVAGNTVLGGFTAWNVGDYAWCDGVSWFKVENLADAEATSTSRGTVQPDNITTFVTNGIISAVQTSLSGRLLGAWTPVTNTPSLVNGVGVEGDYYISTADGSCNFGAGLIAFTVGSVVQYHAGQWINTGAVLSTDMIQVPPSFTPQIGLVVGGDNTTTALEKLQGQIGATPLVVKVADYTIVPTDKVVLVKADNLIVTLPDASQVIQGYIYTVKVGGNYNLTINTQFGQTVDGSITYPMGFYNSMGFFSDGFDWFVV